MVEIFAHGCLWWKRWDVLARHRYSLIHEMHSSAPMLVYMLTALYVKINAFKGRVILSSSFFRSTEFLK
jgi:hypothetical protein